MSSTNKTPYYELNSWIGSDIPCREDFNRDNSIVDGALHAHAENTHLHTTDAEKNVWNQPYYLGTYTGNGNSTRTVNLGCGFDPAWGLVFPANKLPSVDDYNNKAHYNYFALLSSRGSTIGVTLSGRQLSVVQSAVAVSGCEYRSFNESGVTYIYIVFR